MDIKLDNRVTPSLHPLNVAKIDGYDQRTAIYVEQTERILDAAYKGIGAVWDAREAARTDPTLNEAAQIIKTDDVARKVFASVAKQFDAERANLEKGIAHIEKQLTAPVTARAAAPIAKEIRAHCKNLPVDKRYSFVTVAIERGDDDTASSVLGAPSYLSGIEPDVHAALLRHYHEKASPDEALRLKVMRGAKELLENRGGLLFVQLERAVGEQPHKVQRLREAKGKADKVFAAVPAAA